MTMMILAICFILASMSVLIIGAVGIFMALLDFMSEPDDGNDSA